MKRRTPMLALMLTACCPATWAGDLTAAQVAPMMAQLRAPTEAASLEQQVAALQKQVTALQSQVNALLAAVKVTETGVVLQGPTVTIAGGTITVKSNAHLSIEANSLRAEVQRTTTLNSGEATTILSSSAVIAQATGPVELRGTLVRLNGGNKAVATAGSVVGTSPGGSSQVINGSATVFAD